MNRENNSENNLENKRPVSPISGAPVPVNPNGRPKGVPNKATTKFKEALNELFEVAAPEMVDWLKQVEDPKERFDILAKFVNYIYPQLSRQDVNHGGQTDNPVNFTLTRVIIDPIKED